jgi:hypothetical protein
VELLQQLEEEQSMRPNVSSNAKPPADPCFLSESGGLSSFYKASLRYSGEWSQSLSSLVSLAKAWL